MLEMAPEVRGLYRLMEIANRKELKDFFKEGETANFWIACINCAVDSCECDTVFINETVKKANQVLEDIRVSAEKKGIQFYPHNIRSLDSFIGLNNLMSLMCERESQELKDALRLPTEEEKKYGMAPSVTPEEVVYNATGYFLAALLKKLCVRLEELRAQC
ncbi:MAG: hypothetical protein HY813_02130 [Candidatus Portnoybacteria bacterium]|nr:hypothetical protein [Candidatus Portnoybacteria bacterium]